MKAGIYGRGPKINARATRIVDPLMKVVILSFAALSSGLNVYDRYSCAFGNYEKLAEASSHFPSQYAEGPTGRRSGLFLKKPLGRKKSRSKDFRRSKVLRQLRRHPKTRKQARYFYENDESGLGSRIVFSLHLNVKFVSIICGIYIEAFDRNPFTRSGSDLFDLGGVL